MTNFDLKGKTYTQAANELVEAAKGDSEEVFAASFVRFASCIEQAVMAEAQKQMQEAEDDRDTAVLVARGTRQLTSEEREFYQQVTDAMRSAQPKQALAGLDVAMPKTIVDDVFSDLITSHELLDAIDFTPTGAVVEWLMNTNTKQLATWAPLTASIVTELTSGFKKLDFSLCKLSAFLPVSKAMLDLGPEWIDRYVRTVLAEALALGLEDGVLNGRGQNQNIHEPIGMRKNLAGAIDPSTGYPDKTPIVVTKIDPTTWGAIRKKLAAGPGGKSRQVGQMLMVVSPADYEGAVAPATTLVTQLGYAENIFPRPTKVVQSVLMAEGQAVVGIAKLYFMAAGIGKGGRIEYSDEYRFLEDERVYVVRFYGYGQPKDNNAFLLLDISGLAPVAFPVYVTNAAEFPGNDLPEG